MTDVFIITPKQPSRLRQSKGKQDITSRYTALQGQFLSSSYGYYANYFIQKISSEASAIAPETEVLCINMTLREMVRKFLLTDLELVFLGHVASQLEWAFTKPFYRQHCQILKAESEQFHKNTVLLSFFLHLCACFVKNYVGQLQEADAISEFMGAETGGEWQGAYEEWLKLLPSQLFKLSPRGINSIFREYSRDCLKVAQPKNYSCMVDRILELSTTYSMIPGEARQKKRLADIYEQSSSGRKMVKKNRVDGYGSNISKKQQFPIKEQPLLIESRLSSNFIESKPKQTASAMRELPKRGLLKLKTKNPQVTNHITEFYSKRQYDLPLGKEDFRPESNIGFQNSVPSLLDFNNRSSVYEAIPYTLRNNSNLSNFWK